MVEAFEALARARVTLGNRYSAPLQGLVHPVLRQAAFSGGSCRRDDCHQRDSVPRSAIRGRMGRPNRNDARDCPSTVPFLGENRAEVVQEQSAKCPSGQDRVGWSRLASEADSRFESYLRSQPLTGSRTISRTTEQSSCGTRVSQTSQGKPAVTPSAISRSVRCAYPSTKPCLSRFGRFCQYAPIG